MSVHSGCISTASRRYLAASARPLYTLDHATEPRRVASEGACRRPALVRVLVPLLQRFDLADIVRGCAGRPVCCLKRLLRWPLRARAGRCRGSVSLSRAAICVTHGGFCHLSIGSTFYAHLPGKGRLGAGAGAGAGARSAAARRAQQRVGWGRRRGGGGGGGGGGSARAARATGGRSSDRWRGRCSVCARTRALLAQSATRQGQAWRRGTRGGGGEQPSAPCAVRRPGEGAAGDWARDQPTPGVAF